MWANDGANAGYYCNTKHFCVREPRSAIKMVVGFSVGYFHIANIIIVDPNQLGSIRSDLQLNNYKLCRV